MNKIIILGHPSSQYLKVEELLIQCGMARASNSRREGLSPVEIDELLLVAHPKKAHPEEPYPMVKAGPVWSGLALDLLLGNIKQPLWGWADTNAIRLTDYWKESDPNIIFVLVYDRPDEAVLNKLRNDLRASEEDLKSELESWRAYNESMLRFHYRNRERSVLVHGTQACTSVDTYLQELRSRITVPMRLPDVGAFDKGTAIAHEPFSVMKKQCAALEDLAAVKSFVVSDYVAQHSRATTIYEELQAAANLPEPETTVNQHESLLQRVTAVHRLSELLSAAFDDLEARGQQVDVLENSLASVEREVEKLESEKSSLLSNLLALQCEAERQIVDIQALKDEVLTLRRIEKSYRERGETVEKLTSDMEINRRKLQELEHTLAQALDRKHDWEELKRENEKLLRCLYDLQEKFEEKILLRRDRGMTEKTKSSALVGAAERVKNHLSYRLGAAMISRSRTISGWIGMPWGILIVIKQYKAERSQNSHVKLPPIAKYDDAAEADKVRKHLSYRLGSTLIQYGRNPLRWFMMPFALHAQLRAFRRERTAAV